MGFSNTTKISQTSEAGGFTLLELLIALSIFAVGILAVATMQTMAINGNATARKHTEPSIFLGDRVETLMSLADTNSDLAASGNPHSATMNTGYITYTTQWNVTDSTDYKSVDVTVSWEDRGTTRTKALSFIKPKDD